jgi:Reverse transcriptase (RNA-dependent DNA polymerase)
MGYFTHINSLDSPTHTDILTMEDKVEQSQWFAAMDDEVNAMLSKNTFCRVKRELATLTKAEIVGTTWVFKSKRRLDGTTIILKARLVVRGSQQKHVGRTINETYAPVVEWSTIRLLLTLAVTRYLCTTQIDFKNDFVQSDLPAPVYVELPPGDYRSHPENTGMILEVNKSLYGDRRAPKLWYMYLQKKLENIGFVVDANDACLLPNPGVFLLIMWTMVSLLLNINPLSM